jgi:hypothetical protein
MSLSQSSIKKLATVHADLQMLVHAVNKVYPIQVICGERNEKEQNHAYEIGASKKRFPDSKHNVNIKAGRIKSHAVDIVPDPDKNSKTLDWNDIEEFEKMLLVVEQKADELDIKIRLGRDFSFADFPHVELRS